MPTIANVQVHDVPATPTISEIIDRAAATVPAAQRAAYRVEIRAGLERDAAARRRRDALGESAASAIERGLLSVGDGTRAPKRLSGRELFLARSRGGGVDPAAPAPMRGRSAFLSRGRFGGYDSPEEQRAGATRERAALIGADGVPEALSTEATLQRVTVAPPGYGRQAGPKPSLPFSSTPPTAPSAQQAIERGSSAPPYALVRGRDLHGAALANFRSRFGKDPAPDEMIDPRTLGGGR